MRLLQAFFWRDFRIESSYRVSFLLNLFSIVVTVLTYYFISQLISDGVNAMLEPYGGDYFSFVIIGIAFGGYFGLGLNGFSRALREAQTTGTLEAMLMTPAPVSAIVIGSSVWSYTFTTFRVIIILTLGTLFLGLNLSQANYAAALVILGLSIIAFASLGIIAASFIMVLKRGDPVAAIFGSLAVLVGGVLYPIEILPDWLQFIARLIPITYALRAMREALLAGADWSTLQNDVIALIIFCIVLLPASLIAFRKAVELARSDGSLTHY